jgi:hypothetical protein
MEITSMTSKWIIWTMKVPKYPLQLFSNCPQSWTCLWGPFKSHSWRMFYEWIHTTILVWFSIKDVGYYCWLWGLLNVLLQKQQLFYVIKTMWHIFINYDSFPCSLWNVLLEEEATSWTLNCNKSLFYSKINKEHFGGF